MKHRYRQMLDTLKLVKLADEVPGLVNRNWLRWQVEDAVAAAERSEDGDNVA